MRESGIRIDRMRIFNTNQSEIGTSDVQKNVPPLFTVFQFKYYIFKDQNQKTRLYRNNLGSLEISPYTIIVLPKL